VTKRCLDCSAELSTENCYVLPSKGGVLAPRCNPCERARVTRWLHTKLLSDPFYTQRNNLKKMGVTLAQYENLWTAQGGACYVCHEVQAWRNLNVDHDHACCPGRYSCGVCVKRLLCDPCNKALGMMCDRPDLARRLATYLEETRV
jgi:hypothetical protein